MNRLMCSRAPGLYRPVTSRTLHHNHDVLRCTAQSTAQCTAQSPRTQYIITLMYFYVLPSVLPSVPPSHPTHSTS